MYSEIPINSIWKHSCVTPLLKKKTPSCGPGNYRPTDSAFTFCLLFKKNLKSHMAKHIEANSVFNMSRHGFASGNSVTTNMFNSTMVAP